MASSWICDACTYRHVGKDEQLFLACQVCQTPRTRADSTQTIPPSPQSEGKLSPSVESSKQSCDPNSQVDQTKPGKSSSPSTLSSQISTPVTSSSWGSLRPPTQQDVVGKRKRRKGLDAPPPLLDYIMVLDFEWTADNKQPMLPVAEITQFPSVLMKLFESRDAATTFYSDSRASAKRIPSKISSFSNVNLPEDLTMPTTNKIRHDALAVAGFDTFVRPTLNPKLSKFSIELTAISQANVDK
ncbi:MAG: hypothetical protein SGILL_008479, partial [Bacillariaceae sp.]